MATRIYSSFSHHLHSIHWSNPALWIGITLWIAYAIWFILTIPSLPFHPDESTQIFMSADVELFAQSPNNLFWQPELSLDLRQKYRELDAPLTRYLIGIFRSLGGLPATPEDWSWSKTWEENDRAGALPNAKLLFLARLPSAIFALLSVLLIFFIGKKIISPLFGFLCAALLALNPLFLLHTRRAMAESGLVFWILLTLLLILTVKRQYWLCAITSTFAIATKQTGLLLLPICLAGYFFFIRPFRLLSFVKTISLFGILSLAIWFLLNPFVWQHPVQALQSALQSRQDLSTAQAKGIESIAPEKVNFSLQKKTNWLLVNTFLSTPAVYDVGNYIDNTKPSETEYFAAPINNWLRGIVPGAVQFGLFLIGIYFSLVQKLTRRKSAIFIGFCLLFMILGQYLTPLPFQRYIMPIIPLVIFFVSAGIYHLISPLAKFYDKRAA